jgi:hypothetical protein
VVGVRRRLVAVATICFAGSLLAACGAVNDNAVAACHQVNRAIATYEHALTLTGGAKKVAISHATAQLDTALGDAASATSQDGSYNALMTTIGEAARVPLKNLVPSLRQQCGAILNPNPNQPQP